MAKSIQGVEQYTSPDENKDRRCVYYVENERTDSRGENRSDGRTGKGMERLRCKTARYGAGRGYRVERDNCVNQCYEKYNRPGRGSNVSSLSLWPVLSQRGVVGLSAVDHRARYKPGRLPGQPDCRGADLQPVSSQSDRRYNFHGWHVPG